MSEQPDSAIETFACVLNAWHAHEKELRSYLIHRVGDRPTAEDMLQEIFLKSIRQGVGFCQLDNPRAWLFQVARNTVVDHVRLEKPQIELTEELVAPPENHCDPVDELAICLIRNLTVLSPEDRHLVEQCDLQGIPQQDYAEVHGLSLTAMKSRLRRAR
jgi:RNA polymerase sigma-70 factor (ECF subfamily)